MATHRAIEAACAGVVHLLEDAYDADVLPGVGVDFRLVGEERAGRATGVGVLAHRVDVSSVRPDQRSPAGLPVDVHVVLVVSTGSPATTLALTGWVMRTLADHAVLTPDLLNRGTEEHPVFGADELVAIASEAASSSDLLGLRETVGVAAAAMVLPYVLTRVVIETRTEAG